MTVETWKHRKGWGVEIPYVKTDERIEHYTDDSGREMTRITVKFEPPKQDM